MLVLNSQTPTYLYDRDSVGINEVNNESRRQGKKTREDRRDAAWL